jgi:serine/threonine-protein kinase
MSDPLTQPASPESTTAPAAEEAPPDLTGKTLGDFRVLRLLGQGGMGHVYLAEQISLKRQVALKLLKHELAANPTSLQRFKQEAHSVARATHANIVQIYAVGEADGVHYMALEFVEGKNLREYLEKKGTPEVPMGVRIMSQVSAALQRASELGIVHRDIKPENILLTRKGEVKVADFGLSRAFTEEPGQAPSLTQSRVTMGTPLYMSPEQVEGKRTIDHRSDIYSFGVTCYHMFAGHPPFRGESPFDVAVQHVQKEPEPLHEIRPDLPADLCTIIHKMMAKQPEARYQTARELSRDVNRLRDLLAIAGTTALAPTLGVSGSSEAVDAVTPPHLTAPIRGHRVALIALVPLALVAGLGVGWLRHQSTPEPNSGGSAQPQEHEEPVSAKVSALEREKELVKFFQTYAKSGQPGDEPAAVRIAVDLGLFYLNQKRFDDADKFFKDLMTIETKVPLPYRSLSRVGQAIVLAFKGEHQESNKLFLTTFPDSDKPVGKSIIWRTNPALREMIAKALNHNYANSPPTFPERLQAYRRPPVPVNVQAKKE